MDTQLFGIEKLNKRAKAKFSQEPLNLALRKLTESKLHKKYVDTFFCGSVIQQKGEKMTSRYCRHRWCKVCNRIRTGKLINGYADTLENLNDKQFVTLTIPNVNGDELKSAILQMNKTIRKIQDNRRKQKKPLIKGIRKLECTYNVQLNNFHPHFHFIIENEKIADQLINEWLKYYPKANIKGQHKATATECKELFKYFTKLTSNAGKVFVNGTRAKDEWHYPEAIDVIFTAIIKLRIIQPMGGLKMVSDEIDEIQSEIIDGETLEIKESELYIWNGENWFSPYTGELLSSFKPKIHLRRFREKIRYLHKDLQNEQ
jgi:Replication protein